MEGLRCGYDADIGGIVWHDGVIQPSYRLACVPAFCGTNARGDLGMYIDYQLLLDSGQVRLTDELIEPPPPGNHLPSC